MVLKDEQQTTGPDSLDSRRVASPALARSSLLLKEVRHDLHNRSHALLQRLQLGPMAATLPERIALARREQWTKHPPWKSSSVTRSIAAPSAALNYGFRAPASRRLLLSYRLVRFASLVDPRWSQHRFGARLIHGRAGRGHRRPSKTIFVRSSRSRTQSAPPPPAGASRPLGSKTTPHQAPDRRRRLHPIHKTGQIRRQTQ